MKAIVSENKEIKYQLIRSNRKTLSISLDENGDIIAKAPLRMQEYQIAKFIESKKNWIIKKQAQMKIRRTNHAAEKALDIHMIAPKGLTYGEWASRIITRRVAELATLMQVRYGNIHIRQQKTRWGSCSSKGNLNFNWRLVLMPEEVMDYVIIHELCHLRYMNHSKEFWQYVGSVMPDYAKWKQWLKEY